MAPRVRLLAALAAVFGGLLLAHLPLLQLPYFWDEAGYYVPAGLDFYRHGLLIPRSTVPSGHTPLVLVYLGIVWHLLGFSQVITRAAMLLIAAATVVGTYALARSVAGRETAIWSALLLALSPLFFAQSSLVFLDLAAACFTVWSLLFLLQERWLWFALSASGALMSKETAVVMLPVIWLFVLLRRKERRTGAWLSMALPVIPLAAWGVYYHHATGFWTGNSAYLQYNLYSALAPLHVIRSFVARVCEVLFQGFNWPLTAGAIVGIWYANRQKRVGSMQPATQPAGTGASQASGLMRHSLSCDPPSRNLPTREFPSREFPSRDRKGAVTGISKRLPFPTWHDFNVLALALIAAYVLMLSFVGGAVLPRYMLPVMPLFIILAFGLMSYLPNRVRHGAAVIVAACFVASWFINPPYPFPYEDNLAYADFIRLHQDAAHYIESLPGNPVTLTAWPATDELRQPLLGYVDHPLRVAQVENFTAAAFDDPPQFNLLYLYSRKWQPDHNLLTAIGPARKLLERFYDYLPPVSAPELAARLHLKLLKLYERRGQWVRIYARK